jgi:hypothetical protein
MIGLYQLRFVLRAEYEESQPLLRLQTLWDRSMKLGLYSEGRKVW